MGVFKTKGEHKSLKENFIDQKHRTKTIRIFIVFLFSYFLKILFASVQNGRDLIENSSAEEDLGVLLGNKLSTSQQRDLLAKRDNDMLCAIRGLCQQVLGGDPAPLFSLVSPHLDCYAQFWAPH